MKRHIAAFFRHSKPTVAVLVLTLLTTLWAECIAQWLSGPLRPQGGSNPLDSVSAFLFSSTTYAASEQVADDKTLSPYFQVKSDDSSLDTLPLKSTAADVTVSGVIAEVKVTQTYRNEGKKPIEAVYVFPASTRAAVHGMRMTIGERTIVAAIEKRDEARRTYQQAKEQGKSASLLEQQRPNVFQMSVANIMPGDEIKTELQYTEMVVPTDGTYEFVYPTVVGPRYSNQPAATAPPTDKWVANPYLHQGEKPPYTFDIKVHLSTGIPLQEVTCGSHPVDIQFAESSKADVRLKKGEEHSGNRDFILKYRLAGKQIQTGLLLYEGQKENFFLLTLQPPERVTLKEVPPREYVFIVDVSGSMHGFPLDVSKNLMKNLLHSLRAKDTFNVLLFSGGSSLLSERSLPATPDNVRRAVDLLERQQGGGGTELLPALQRALVLPKAEGAARVFVIATDGYVAVETESFDLLQKRIGQASFFSFGIGSSVNRFLIEGLARAGAGESFVVTKPDEAPAKADAFRKLIESPVLTQVKLNLGQFDAYDLEPTGIPDLFADKPIVVTGKWRGAARGKITLTGFGGGGPHEQSVEVSSARPDNRHGALQALWARSRIARISDYNQVKPNDERTQQVTNLGLQYHLLTAYTSFVAVDSQVRNKGGESSTVTQPLPLPEGVSDYAVGGKGGMIAPSAAPAMRKSTGLSIAVPTSPPAEQASRDFAAEAGRVRADKETDEQRQEKAGKPRITSLTVQGGIAESTIRDHIERHLPFLVLCRGKRFIKGSSDALTLTFTIDGKGQTGQGRIVSPSALHPETERCFLKAIKGWRFAAPGPGGETSVTVSLQF